MQRPPTRGDVSAVSRARCRSCVVISSARVSQRRASDRFSPEVRERAVRMVEEHREAHASEWAVLQSVAPKLGCTAETLRKWVRQAQRDAGHRPGLS